MTQCICWIRKEDYTVDVIMPTFYEGKITVDVTMHLLDKE